MFGGTLTNTAIIEGDGSNTPELRNAKVTSSNAAYPRNGGLFYLAGID